MNLFRALGIFFFVGLIISWVANNTMPRILMQTARLGGTISRGSRDIAIAFGSRR